MWRRPSSSSVPALTLTLPGLAASHDLSSEHVEPVLHAQHDVAVDAVVLRVAPSAGGDAAREVALLAQYVVELQHQ